MQDYCHRCRRIIGNNWPAIKSEINFPLPEILNIPIGIKRDFSHIYMFFCNTKKKILYYHAINVSSIVFLLAFLSHSLWRAWPLCRKNNTIFAWLPWRTKGRLVEKLAAIRLFITHGTACHATKAERNYGLMNASLGDWAPPCRSSLERHRYPRGLPFTWNADNTGCNKDYTLISVSHEPPRAGRDDDFPSTTSHKAPRLASAASWILRGFHYANGLPDVNGGYRRVTP